MYASSFIWKISFELWYIETVPIKNSFIQEKIISQIKTIMLNKIDKKGELTFKYQKAKFKLIIFT